MILIVYLLEEEVKAATSADVTVTTTDKAPIIVPGASTQPGGRTTYVPKGIL